MNGLEFEAIGTVWKIEFFQLGPFDFERNLKQKIFARIEEFDRIYSRFRQDSSVKKMAQQKGRYEFPPEAQALFAVYRTLYDLTDGLFTPLIGQVMHDAGYDTVYSLKPGEPHSPPTWNGVMEWQAPMLMIKQPARLDFGAAGKGYLADLVAEVIEAQGISDFCINAGGDIVARGANIKIALEDPRDSKKAIGTVQLQNKSICGSAGNRRVWDQFHHIINPKTLTSPKTILATWVIADSGLLSDALATCLFFTSAQKLQTVYPFEYVMLFEDGHVECSPIDSLELFS